MIRGRTNSQKPDDELIRQFQRTFSDIISKQGRDDSADQAPNELVNPSRPNTRSNAMKLNEQSRRNTPDLRMSSSFVDLNSVESLPFTDQSHSFYSQNSGYNRFHSHHAGDLHTPMGFNMTNPYLQQRGTTTSMDAGATNMGLDQFDQQVFSSPFQNPLPFAQQSSLAPSAFQQDVGFDLINETLKSPSNDLELQDPSPKMVASDADMPGQSEHQNPTDQKFRYNTTLRAPTAMTKNSKDIPITYLNKGQAYSLSVVDLNPPSMGPQMVRYRTSIRVTFHEEEQRMKSGACWQLWKETRGASEAYQRGGKIQALEYIDPFQGGNEDRKARQVQVESTSLDGFCIMWAANPSTGASECTVPVRFNFLSTDFSRSKGVKGIPVRLCAKTQVVFGIDRVEMDQKAVSELCFCQVKLFRDHGAERKLLNDAAHVKKMIEKLEQQIVQAEMGGGSNGKRKRANTSVTFDGGHSLPKINKRKRTWSMGSRDGVDRDSLADDLHAKLAVMQEMFTSTSPVSSLNMQADKQDDPDLYPVQLPSDVKRSSSSRRQEVQNPFGFNWTLEGATTSPVTGSPQNILCCPQYDLGYQTPLSSRGSSLPVSENSSQPVKVQRANLSSSASTGYLKAIDIDPTYHPPVERRIKPIACFYLRFPKNETQKDDYYRAVYLSERTVKDLMDKISVKRPIDIKRVLRILLVKKGGVNIMVDDDVVRELPEGQDMDVEISKVADTSESPDDSRPPAFEVRLSC